MPRTRQYPKEYLSTTQITTANVPETYTVYLVISVEAGPNYGTRDDNWSFVVGGSIVAEHPAHPTQNITGAFAHGTIVKAMTDKTAPTTSPAGSTNGAHTATHLGSLATTTTVECTRTDTSMAVKGTALGLTRTVTVAISLPNVKESSAVGVPPNPNYNP